MFALTPWRGAPGTSQPKTFSRQAELPKLPIPPLEETLPRYLRSLEPILAQKEELGELPVGGAAVELEKRKQWAAEAVKPGSLVRKLQERLHDVDRTSPNNWLDDRFWIQKAYHEWRVPLLVNSNWWLFFRPDPNTPDAALEASADPPRVGKLLVDSDPSKALGEQTWDNLEWGVRRATWLTHRFLQFKRRLDEEDIMPDASKAGAFCMHQYTRLLGVTRIPAVPHDYVTEAAHPIKAKHISVLIRNNIYELQVIGDDGKQVPFEAIEKALYAMIEDARKADGPAVSILTASDRDTWARDREHLLSVSPVNRASINSLEDSIFALSIDSSVLPVLENYPGAPHIASPPTVDAQARNTCGAGRGGHNRWFDKALTITMEPNGRAGMCGEHSPCDALIPSILADFALAEPAPVPGSSFPTLPSVATSGSAEWKKLSWELDDKVQQAIDKASASARELSAASDIGMLWFNEYGADWIKKVAKQSPDAYLQMVLQLAYAKVRGRQTATYETASTRLYKHGRTDVIRSFSSEAYAFVRAVRENKPTKELYALLSAATAAHNAQTRASSMGRGFDRHITGLRLVYNPAEDGDVEAITKPEAGGRILFGDELLGESQTWKLSTSGLSAGDRFAGTGFGAGYPDGYGINYLAGAHLLKFGIESKHPSGGGELGENPTNGLAKAIVESLKQMRDICEKEAPPAADPKGKL